VKSLDSSKLDYIVESEMMNSYNKTSDLLSPEGPEWINTNIALFHKK